MKKTSISSARPRRRMQGLTIVEMMVAITIGMIIVAAMAMLFANNSRARGETERNSQKIENGRYALELLSGELQHAGFFGVFDPAQVSLPAAKPDPCATSAADLRDAMGLHVQGYDDVTSTVLTCLSDVKPGTDVVVIRRAAACAQGEADCTNWTPGTPAFQASSCATELATPPVTNHYRLDTTTTTFTLKRRNCTAVAEFRRYLVRIYFVANNDKSGDGIPTLKRAELSVSGGAPAFRTTSLVQGVENLQLEYGMHTAGTADGSPDVYTASPDIYQTCAAAACVQRWASVMAVKVYVLSRNVEPSAGHSDTKKYVMGRVADAVNGGGAAKEIAATGDAYKRAVYYEAVRLQNPSGRRFSPS